MRQRRSTRHFAAATREALEQENEGRKRCFARNNVIARQSVNGRGGRTVHLVESAAEYYYRARGLDVLQDDVCFESKC